MIVITSLIVLFSDSKLDLTNLPQLLAPDNYFGTFEERISWRTYGQVYKDCHDILAHQLSNLELVVKSPYILSNLLKRGTRLSHESVKRALNGYFNRMSASSEFNFVADDLSHLILNFQRIQDNNKLIVTGKKKIEKDL